LVPVAEYAMLVRDDTVLSASEGSSVDTARKTEDAMLMRNDAVPSANEPESAGSARKIVPVAEEAMPDALPSASAKSVGTARKPMIVPAEDAMSMPAASLSASESPPVDSARKPKTVPVKPDAVPGASASFCLNTARMLDPVAEAPQPAARRSSTHVGSKNQVTSVC